MPGLLRPRRRRRACPRPCDRASSGSPIQIRASPLALVACIFEQFLSALNIFFVINALREIDIRRVKQLARFLGSLLFDSVLFRFAKIRAARDKMKASAKIIIVSRVRLTSLLRCASRSRASRSRASRLASRKFIAVSNSG